MCGGGGEGDDDGSDNDDEGDDGEIDDGEIDDGEIDDSDDDDDGGGDGDDHNMKILVKRKRSVTAAICSTFQPGRGRGQIGGHKHINALSYYFDVVELKV